MSDPRDALIFLDLDKGGEAAGPLFEEPRRRLQGDPRLRRGWSQFQALRALAWECAPEPGDKLLKLALLETRRERVKSQLARAAGNEDLARQILLGKLKSRSGFPAWVWGLLVLGAGLLASLAWRQGLFTSTPAVPLPEPLPASVIKGPDEAVPFEFPAQTPPAEAALSAPQPVTGEDDSQDVHHEDAASRQARQLLRQHLHDAQARAGGAGADDAAQDEAPAPKVARRKRVPSPTPTALALAMVSVADANAPVVLTLPTAAPTAAPSPVPTLAPTALPTPPPTALPTAAPTAPPTAAPTAAPTAPPTPGAANADLALSASDMAVGGSLVVTLGLPERKDLDLRVFDLRGKPVRKLAEGPYGPGAVRFTFTAKDDAGADLPAGTYYLRAMTAWYSRVEPIQIH